MKRSWLLGTVILLAVTVLQGQYLYASLLMNRAYLAYVGALVQNSDEATDRVAQESLYQVYQQASIYRPALCQESLYRLLPVLISGELPEVSLNGICPRSAEDFLFLRLLDRAKTETKAQRYVEAESLYEWLAFNCPESFEVFTGWAGLKRGRGDYEPAIRLMETAMTLEPQLPPFDFRQADVPRPIWRDVTLARTYTEIGVILQENQQYEQAILVLEASIELYPPGTVSPWLYNLLGVLCYETWQLDKAKWAFEEALAIEPNLPEAPMYLELIEERR